MTLRKMTTDFLTRAQHETQSPAREDIDNVLLSVRQVETRILDRLDDLSCEVNELRTRVDGRTSEPAGQKRPARRPGGKGTAKTKSSRRSV
jgi:hypothetical protein